MDKLRQGKCSVRPILSARALNTKSTGWCRRSDVLKKTARRFKNLNVMVNVYWNRIASLEGQLRTVAVGMTNRCHGRTRIPHIPNGYQIIFTSKASLHRYTRVKRDVTKEYQSNVNL
eukprot:9474790-Pyramimonas_sp.AAC.1